MNRQILHNYFPRSDITTRDWHKSSSNSNKPTSLDVYDSFDKLDHTITDHKDAVNNLQWLKKPSFEPVVPKVLQKVIFKFKFFLLSKLHLNIIIQIF